MALISVRMLAGDVILGLWKIEESVEEFYAKNRCLSLYAEDVNSRFKSDNRKKEYLAVRALLYEMLLKAPEITHNDVGKPLLDGYNISISHTKGYAAVILSEKLNVAVDIEYISDRVQKILERFIRTDEFAETLKEQLLHWCAKETVYKYYSEEDLQFFDMRLHGIGQDCCYVDNLKSGKVVKVDYESTRDYMLTYICR